MAPQSITVQTLWILFTRHETDVRERLKAIDDRMQANAQEAVPREVYEERHLALRDRVADLETYQERTLAYRRNLNVAIIGALITSVAALAAALLAVLAH